MRLSAADWLRVEREFCARSLAAFVRRAWPVVEPSAAYVHGWHIDAIAEHLEAVTSGQITRLLINVPPGMTKSLMVGVLWPAWEWGPCRLPQHRFVGAAHAQDLAVKAGGLRGVPGDVCGVVESLGPSEWHRAALLLV